MTGQFTQVTSRITRGLQSLKPLFTAGSLAPFPTELSGSFEVGKTKHVLSVLTNSAYGVKWNQSRRCPGKGMWAEPERTLDGWRIWGFTGDDWAVATITAKAVIKACCTSSGPMGVFIPCEHDSRADRYHLDASGELAWVSLEDFLYVHGIREDQIVSLMRETGYRWAEARKRLYREADRASQALQAL